MSIIDHRPEMISGCLQDRDLTVGLPANGIVPLEPVIRICQDLTQSDPSARVSVVVLDVPSILVSEGRIASEGDVMGRGPWESPQGLCLKIFRPESRLEVETIEGSFEFGVAFALSSGKNVRGLLGLKNHLL